MRNFAFLVVLVLAVVCAAGCMGGSGSHPISTDIHQGTTGTPTPDFQPNSPGNETGNAAGDCDVSAGDTRTYPMNITLARGTNLTREEFLNVNREYQAYLAKEFGQEKAKQMINDEYTRSMAQVLLDPSSGNDTLISITIDPADVHAAGETFTITGTTNLPPGRELTLVIFAGNYDRPIPPCKDPWHDAVPRTAVVQAGDSSKNTWTYSLNTTGFKSDDYLIYVRETRNEGAFLTNTLFHLY